MSLFLKKKKKSKSSLNPVRNQAKAKVEGRVKLTENVSAVDASVTSESRLQSQNSRQWRTPKSAPKGKGAESCEEEQPETSQNVPLGTIDLGSFEVLSPKKMRLMLMNPQMKPQERPASWIKKTETLQHTEMHCEKFRKSCNGDHRDEESPFFDCWDWKHEQSERQKVLEFARTKKLRPHKMCHWTRNWMKWERQS